MSLLTLSIKQAVSFPSGIFVTQLIGFSKNRVGNFRYPLIVFPNFPPSYQTATAMLRQVISPVARSVLRNNQTSQVCRRNYNVGHHKPTTMDDLPVPTGSWEANYKNNQSKYNLHLLLGIVVSAVTVITAKASGLVYLNYSPPSLKD